MKNNSITRIRKNQIITPWGPGAIVPLANNMTSIVAGLDKWQYGSGSDYAILDERLSKKIGVKELREPIYDKRDDVKENTSIPTYVFPNWYYCPKCNHVEYISPTCKTPPHCSECQANNKKKEESLVPERFIMVCPHGHISNLPILRLIHGTDFTEADEKKWMIDPEFREKHIITRHVSGKTGSTADISYRCSCGSDKVFRLNEFKSKITTVYEHCPGDKPWLGKDYKEDCDLSSSELLMLQRGGTNIWFGRTISSLYLPNLREKFEKWVREKHIDQFYSQLNDFELDEVRFREVFKPKNRFPEDEIHELYEYVIKRKKDSNPKDETFDEIEYKYEEYLRLIKTIEGDYDEDLNVKCNDISLYDDYINSDKLFRSISLVKRLKETRALVGFTRVYNTNPEKISVARKILSNPKENINWVPAVQNSGEGIFIRFNEETLKKWAEKEKVKDRLSLLTNNKNRTGNLSFFAGQITPEYVMIHTFSHLLINEVSKECGYGTSSIRERIYVGNSEFPMFGVLLYTSSSGSEGSLGGLVRLGKPGFIEKIISNALENARWCSADPICIESKGQGPDSCNLAACHNCALLPETCCETGNRYLDRGLVIGTLKNPEIGYFSCLINNDNEK